MGEALAIIIAFAALLGISWGVTCAAVWAICALMHWTFTWAAGTAAWIALWLIGSFGSSKKRGADHACTEKTHQLRALQRIAGSLPKAAHLLPHLRPAGAPIKV